MSPKIDFTLFDPSSLHSMAATSSSAVQKRFKYDVFVSFRGEDTRKNFVDHLYHALQRKDIITYKDDARIEKGERISDQLLRSIEESKFHIIVFSKDYASSSWCLEELVKIMECQKRVSHSAYPIFYHVDSTQVRNQSGLVGEAFTKHKEKEDAGRWRHALTEAANLSGWDLKITTNGHEANFIQQIAQDISLMLSLTGRDVDENLIGMETRVKNVISYLKNGVSDVRFSGIWGMRGSGKTTLARVVFNHISSWFEGTSFVENVREVSNNSLSGVKELQKKVLSDALNDQSIVVKSVSDGKNKMIKMMGSRKVLVVLDDVDNIGQLEVLAGKPNWFKPGSRIIITTRDEQVLKAHRVDIIHHVNLLSNEEALCLFSRYAFGGDIPIQGYEELSAKVVRYAAGLPLAIKDVGSSLFGRTENEWIDALERLKAMLWKEPVELRYDDLEDHKEVFSYGACILKGQDKYLAMRILEIYGVDVQTGSRIFKQKSSITDSDNDCLCVHDHIEEVDGYFDHQLNSYELNKRKRLRITEETKDPLLNNLAIEDLRTKLEDTDLHPAKHMKALTNNKELEFLYVDDGRIKWNIDEVGKYLPNTLRSLYWCNYPFWWLPKSFQADNLVNLEMNGSNISHLWEGGDKKVLKNLRFLDLSNSKLRTFDLGMTPNLETLRLENCRDLEEFHIPFECPNLIFLNLTVSKLSSLNLRLVPNLEGLYLEECNEFVELRMPVEPSKLKLLEVSGSKVSSLWLTPHLEKLDSLEDLTLSIKEIKHLPDSICMLKHLKSLKLKSCLLLEKLPQDLDRLVCLEELYVMDCTSLRDIPNSVCKMKCLRCLHLPHCIRVKQLPEELGRLECLKKLNIEGTGLRHLPQSIIEMKGLCIVWSRGRLESYGFTSLKEISKYTASCYV